MEPLKHECGVAMIRLLKPLEYYQEKYGTWMYGLNKLYLLMEKQHNRGQEGAGLACVKLEANPGEEYMFRERALGSGAITEIFGTVQNHFKDLAPEQLHDAGYAKKCLPFAGEVYMGHLRYSTTGKSGISYVHPFLRRNNWRAKNLALCGNFNMTNVDEIFARITADGQHPRKYADTYIMLEQVGHRLDREVERLYVECEKEGLKGMDITHAIEDRIDLGNVLKTSSKEWDGGYVICGMTGSGESFAVRDPWGIRPAATVCGIEKASDKVMVPFAPPSIMINALRHRCFLPIFNNVRLQMKRTKDLTTYMKAPMPMSKPNNPACPRNASITTFGSETPNKTKTSPERTAAIISHTLALIICIRALVSRKRSRSTPWAIPAATTAKMPESASS